MIRRRPYDISDGASLRLDLMDVLRAVAAERQLPLVEAIPVLDRDRKEVLASYVHLTPLGNARLATAIRETLAAHGIGPSGAPNLFRR